MKVTEKNSVTSEALAWSNDLVQSRPAIALGLVSGFGYQFFIMRHFIRSTPTPTQTCCVMCQCITKKKHDTLQTTGSHNSQTGTRNPKQEPVLCTVLGRSFCSQTLKSSVGKLHYEKQNMKSFSRVVHQRTTLTSINIIFQNTFEWYWRNGNGPAHHLSR